MRSLAIIALALLAGCLPRTERWNVTCHHEGKTYEFRDLAWDEFQISARSASFYREGLKLRGDLSCTAIRQEA